MGNITLTDYMEIFKEELQEVKEALFAKGKTYMYVEATHKDINNGKPFLGLFKGGYPVGKGHGMGWYGTEYLRFTKLLAANEDSYNKFFPQIPISTMLRIEKFRAKNNKEAREKFFK